MLLFHQLFAFFKVRCSIQPKFISGHHFQSYKTLQLLRSLFAKYTSAHYLKKLFKMTNLEAGLVYCSFHFTQMKYLRAWGRGEIFRNRQGAVGGRDKKTKREWRRMTVTDKHRQTKRQKSRETWRYWKRK